MPQVISPDVLPSGSNTLHGEKIRDTGQGFISPTGKESELAGFLPEG